MQKLVIVFLVIIVAACSGEQKISPKPRAYPKVVYPERSYHLWDSLECPLSLEIPHYSTIELKESGEKSAEKACWFDLVFPAFDAQLHCSYYPIEGLQSFEKYKADAFKLVDKHNSKANYIERFPIRKEDNSSGFLFKIDGPVASNYQFYLTDSTQHFLRGSLYFRTQVQIDSLQEVIDFLYKDIEHIISSVEWKT